MNDSGYVSLEVIAGFRKVKELSTNMEDIFEALKGSETVMVDEANLLIKPAFVFERKTVILREVPVQTTEAEIRGLFEGIGAIEDVKMEFVGTWYKLMQCVMNRFVVMESEKVAVAALDVLRQRTLHDQSVKARLKNESYLRNLMKELNVTENGLPSEYLVPMQGQPMMFMGYNGQPMVMGFPQAPMYNQSIPATVFNEKYVCEVMLMNSKPKKNRKDRKDRKKHDHSNRAAQPKVLPALQNASIFPPLVPTAAPKVGSIETHYTPAEIEAIVKEVKDLSCPPLASEDMDDIVWNGIK